MAPAPLKENNSCDNTNNLLEKHLAKMDMQDSFFKQANDSFQKQMQEMSIRNNEARRRFHENMMSDFDCFSNKSMFSELSDGLNTVGFYDSFNEDGRNRSMNSRSSFSSDHSADTKKSEGPRFTVTETEESYQVFILIFK